MKKSIIYLILTLSMIFTAILPVCASEYYPLFDEPDLLTDSEENELIAKLENICAQKQMEVVVAAFETIGDYTPMEYADDFYDYNGYGYGENRDGLILIIVMDTSDWWISRRHIWQAISPTNTMWTRSRASNAPTNASSGVRKTHSVRLWTDILLSLPKTPMFSCRTGRRNTHCIPYGC